MPDDELEERLAKHAEAFNGLLSLIPAKLYFGEDVSDQWKRKKQTKEQKRAAKRAKLDMDNYKSARDVMEERERAAVAGGKRAREQDADEENVDQELPGEGLKRKKAKTSADGKMSSLKGDATEQDQERSRTPAEKRADKRARRKEKVEKAAKKRERQTAKKQAAAVTQSTMDKIGKSGDEDNADDVAEDIQIDGTLTTQLQESRQDAESSTASSSESQSSTFDTPKSPEAASAPSSISSVQPPTDLSESFQKASEVPTSEQSPTKRMTTPSVENKATSTSNAIQADSNSTNSINSTSKPLKPSAEELRQRLASRIEALRTARKADGLNGQPARTRQELLDTRRRKEEERRAHKKELRRQAKEEEARKQDEEMARRFSPGGSGSLLASPMSPLPSDAARNSFSFGRVAFGDGSQLDEKQGKKQRGPSDTTTALQASEAKDRRIAGLDAEKKATIAEKDMWANANSRARGEKIRDDTSLLKKTLKRQEKKKSRSEKEWKERTEGIQKAGEARQRKREENLQKRKEEKGAGKGKKSGKGKNGSSKAKGNVIRRPGFEGTFRGRTGGGGGAVKQNT